MKKWVGPFLSVFLILILIYLSGPFNVFKITVPGGDVRENTQMRLAQGTEKEEKKEEADPHWIQLLIQVQEKLDAWLKSLNERIESEDVSKIEVRFLEILRNMLEWVKEKVYAKIESSRGKGSPKKGGLFQETENRGSFLVRG